jgi:hypothetical protein
MSVQNAISNGNFDLNLITLRKPLEFNDNTIQTTAYQGSSGGEDLEAVLTDGNSAGGLGITNLGSIQQETGAIISVGSPALIVPTSTSMLSTIAPNFEFKTFQLGGNAGTATGNITLTNNINNTTNYAVFPSIYYGWSGTLGTYTATGTSGAMGQIVISSITSTQFTWNVSKSTGDNVNIFLCFLIVYNIANSDYPKTY